jgi:hypothetical protein
MNQTTINFASAASTSLGAFPSFKSHSPPPLQLSSQNTEPDSLTKPKHCKKFKFDIKNLMAAMEKLPPIEESFIRNSSLNLPLKKLNQLSQLSQLQQRKRDSEYSHMRMRSNPPFAFPQNPFNGYDEDRDLDLNRSLNVALCNYQSKYDGFSKEGGNEYGSPSFFSNQQDLACLNLDPENGRIRKKLPYHASVRRDRVKHHSYAEAKRKHVKTPSYKGPDAIRLYYDKYKSLGKNSQASIKDSSASIAYLKNVEKNMLVPQPMGLIKRKGKDKTYTAK